MSEDILVGKPNRILANQYMRNDYTVRITSPIEGADGFEDEFQLLAGAGPHDVIKFDIVTPGGNADTAHLLCRAISSTAAHTVGYIGPTCASAGTAIALACEEWEIDDMSSFMIHTASYGYYGMAPHIKAFIDHSDRMIERFVRMTYAGFLSEEEILRVLDGREVYFEGEELAQRLSAYSVYRQALRDSYAKAEEALDEDPFDL